MESTARSRTARPGSRFPHAFARPAALLLGIAGAALLAAAAQAASLAARGSRIAAAASPSICAKVNPSAVSAIVGYAVPAASATTIRAKPTAENFGISGVTTLCTFGKQSTLAALSKDVDLQIELTSKPLTATEVKAQLLKSGSPTLKVTVTAYSGLGVPALYFSESGAGIHGEGIIGFAGRMDFGVSVDQRLSRSMLGSLAKLAQRL